MTNDRMAWDICMDSVCKHQVCETRPFEEELKQHMQERRWKLKGSCGGGQSQQHNQCLLILDSGSVASSEREGALFTCSD